MIIKNEPTLTFKKLPELAIKFKTKKKHKQHCVGRTDDLQNLKQVLLICFQHNTSTDKYVDLSADQLTSTDACYGLS